MQSIVDSLVGETSDRSSEIAPVVPSTPTNYAARFAPTEHDVAATVNGEPRRLRATGNMTLLSALRERLGLTAAKEGCGQGDCGSCVVMMGGQPVNACLVLAAEADGQTITTLEGLERDGELHPLQREFTERWAFQCGYCTAGMVMSCFALLQANLNPSEADVREAIEGNLCRCTNYRPIVEAVLAAAATLRAEAQGPDDRD
jgi:carbon-monoxide dehydrogenase small subunit